MSGSDPIAGAPIGGDTGDTVFSAGVGGVVVSGAVAFYSRMQRVATRLLTKRETGTVILRKQVRQSNDDPLEPYTVTETALPRKTVVTGYADKLIDGNAIRAGDRRVVMNADGLSVAPSTNDQLSIDAVLHAIISVKPVPAAGIAAIYIVQARTAGA